MDGVSIYEGWPSDGSNFIDIGGGSRVAWYGDGSGFAEEHYGSDGSRHLGSVFTSPRFSGLSQWRIEAGEFGKVEGLTLSPSIRCNTEGCLHHGWIRDGRWVPA